MAKRKLAKATVKKGHRIAEKLYGRPGVRNPYAVGMAAAKKSARRRKR